MKKLSFDILLIVDFTETVIYLILQNSFHLNIKKNLKGFTYDLIFLFLPCKCYLILKSLTSSTVFDKNLFFSPKGDQ